MSSNIFCLFYCVSIFKMPAETHSAAYLTSDGLQTAFPAGASRERAELCLHMTARDLRSPRDRTGNTPAAALLTRLSSPVVLGLKFPLARSSKLFSKWLVMFPLARSKFKGLSQPGSLRLGRWMAHSLQRAITMNYFPSPVSPPAQCGQIIKTR